MRQVIKLNREIEVDLPKLIDSRLLVQANSGGGKSWLLRRILEQSHGKVQQIVLDPEGEFGTLREKYDYLLAGKGGDIPAEPRSAAMLAHKLLELGVSAIIDLYELRAQERKAFVRLFLDAMVDAPKDLWHPVMVVLDEAHVFAPEKDVSEASSAVKDLATRGRKRGYCAVLATQRISKLAKDAAAECNNKLIGRSSIDIDMKRAAYELGFTTHEQLLSLRSLKPGEFFAFGPALSDEVKKVMVGDVQTTHPTAGARIATKVVPPTDKIKSALKKLTDLPQEAEKELRTSAELRQEVANLRRELTIAKRTPGAPSVRIERIEVPTVGKRALEGLKEAEAKGKTAVKAIKEYAGAVEGIFARLSTELAKVRTQPAPAPRALPAPVRREVIARPALNPTPRDFGFGESLTGPEQRILDAIAWMESIGINEPELVAVAYLADYKHGGGAFNNPKAKLKGNGLVEYRGDRIALTDEGRNLANAPEKLLNTEELHARVLARLTGPERKLLRELLAVYPQDLSNEELAERSGYAIGGAFNNPKGRLRSLGLVEYPSARRIKARALLFLE
jgi:hypothetical protein